MSVLTTFKEADGRIAK